MACMGCTFTYEDLINLIADEITALRFLQSHGVVKTQARCPKCENICREDAGRRIFRCDRTPYVQGVPVPCNTKVYMKKNTWLQRSNLPPDKMVKFVSMWLLVPHPRHTKMMEELRASHNTVVDWSTFCREICIDSLLTRGDKKLGGPGLLVEIYEEKLGKRKDCRGRHIEGSWVLGAFERKTKRAFFVKVPDRSVATLMDIICARIVAGTTIISDRWGEYQEFNNQPYYQHFLVSHTYNFVDPITQAHTQNIESNWKEVQSNIPRVGRREYHMAGYLAEFCWKRRTPHDERVHEFFVEVSRQFDPYRH